MSTKTKPTHANQLARYPLCTKYRLELVRASHAGNKRIPYYVTAVTRQSIEAMLRGKGADWIAKFRELCPDEDLPSANDVEHVLIAMERRRHAEITC